MQDAKLLLVDDDPDVLLAARLLLKRHVGAVDIEKNPEKLPFLLNNNRYDAIVLDMNFQRDVSSGREGFAWLDRILDIDPKARVVLFTAYGDVEMAVRAIKAGAVDFVLKPWQNDKFLDTIRGAVNGKKEETEEREDAQKTGRKKSATGGTSIIGSAMRPVLETVEQVAPTDANVLILGENGTGKDLVARAIHENSHRKDKPFVSVDVGALTESLFESELFGHVKGAFTDARDDRAGRFEEANGGTIFLDEIGNLTPSQQARLLTVLQQRQVTRVGSNKARSLDVRLICATNADLNERVAERGFRQDLLYRINTIELHLPPLRERPSDIGPLAEFFLKKYAKQYNRSVTGLSPALLADMKQYRWPGNVRELQHAVERAVILARPELASGTLLEPGNFVFRKDGNAASPVNETLQLEDMERQLIQQAMQKHRGSITDVARELGVSRQALYRRLEKFGL
ncbi:sigma-54-dependent transcriptional regulator [Spirosoma fluviale]|uniref:DNA-binding transcriptional response regulator, NtrC family, contains REC, AAA-type ATPase, and a Fis-type DNA-binding domains n=1 Tax=Spirosoma fluviale TaxID=1597977 RepID=A0A286G1W0_9BACT|nr:sigma-54 dependent transcriptional regulator [Spirosoma fluviale]SOD89226.1 DNA-binding transcriptional response regulator, NtrC family, contains REC, AAA-type ATPase, and a Fis-type DNA-binding domains [Spirosoma fluviale]